jgi:Phytanoyl-CoA dioxygenase (PhyH)
VLNNPLNRLVRATRRNEFTWRYGFNLGPVLSYRLRPHTLSGEAKRVVAELNNSGVAISTADALLEDHCCYSELQRAVEGLEMSLAEELALARQAANERGSVGQKTFNRELLGSNPILDPQTIFARFALQNPMLQIANAYFGMFTRLRYYNVWHTFASQAEARESQLWHHDREDRYILKLFLYLSDVDEGAGPFTYAPGSHQKKKLFREPSYKLEGGVKRSSDEQMAEVVSSSRWRQCTGPRGTIVFADTRGYHKGGMAREHDRIMYTCMFTSQASQSKELFRPAPARFFAESREQSFALSSLRGPA